MTPCRHTHLQLLPVKGTRLRCRHCHLSIAPEELGDDHCPECYEVYGEKRRDFEPVDDDGKKPTVYRCEDCGATISV